MTDKTDERDALQKLVRSVDHLLNRDLGYIDGFVSGGLIPRGAVLDARIELANAKACLTTTPQP